MYAEWKSRAAVPNLRATSTDSSTTFKSDLMSARISLRGSRNPPLRPLTAGLGQVRCTNSCHSSRNTEVKRAPRDRKPAILTPERKRKHPQSIKRPAGVPEAHQRRIQSRCPGPSILRKPSLGEQRHLIGRRTRNQATAKRPFIFFPADSLHEPPGPG